MKDNEDHMNIPPGVVKTILMNQLSGRIGKRLYLDIYLSSLDEAYKLLNESKILLANSAFERAYFLGFSALEEISKSQLAADVFTELIDEQDFKNAYRDHKKKISRVEWIKIDGNTLPCFSSNKKKINDFDFQKKLKSLYVDADFDLEQALIPKESISKENAENIINAVEIGLFRIYQVTIENGEQIGTKGFMK